MNLHGVLLQALEINLNPKWYVHFKEVPFDSHFSRPLVVRCSLLQLASRAPQGLPRGLAQEFVFIDEIRDFLCY